MIDISTPKDRLESVISLANNIFSYKTLLYIGINARFQFGAEFKDANFDITVVELQGKNCESARKIPWIQNIIQSDIMDFDDDKLYDVVFWWHGPEHFTRSDIYSIIDKIESLSKRLIVIGCPFGINIDNRLYGHVSHLYPDFFHNLGYKTFCVGKRDTKGSSIAAVKKIVKIL
jgi:hypothetical protein